MTKMKAEVAELLNEPDRVRLYESMFLLSQAVAADLNGAIEHIEAILQKGGAELVAIRKWDERRLAYEIDKQKRGVFILTYFKGGPETVTLIERDCNLSEQIMRVMVIRADHLTEDEALGQNDREGLAAEARMRADKAARTEEKSQTGARLGAPEPAPAPAQPEPTGEAEVAPGADSEAEPKPEAGDAAPTPEA
ncbi:MAG: 30S ribosomal protein S6 [Planctomycetota bacterium]